MDWRPWGRGIEVSMAQGESLWVREGVLSWHVGSFEKPKSTMPVLDDIVRAVSKSLPVPLVEMAAASPSCRLALSPWDHHYLNAIEGSLPLVVTVGSIMGVARPPREARLGREGRSGLSLLRIDPGPWAFLASRGPLQMVSLGLGEVMVFRASALVALDEDPASWLAKTSWPGEPLETRGPGRIWLSTVTEAPRAPGRGAKKKG
jgi:uncharacterized protein (AIM24 family)